MFKYKAHVQTQPEKMEHIELFHLYHFSCCHCQQDYTLNRLVSGNESLLHYFSKCVGGPRLRPCCVKGGSEAHGRRFWRGRTFSLPSAFCWTLTAAVAFRWLIPSCFYWYICYEGCYCCCSLVILCVGCDV